MKVSSSSSRLRADVRQADALIRRQVLAGAFNADTAAACRWKAPTWKLLPFLSSPFTDTREERKYLVDELQFYLRNIGHQHGIQVIFVDMRWGIQDQNTKDHKTWEECAKAIEWCKLESMGVVFLSLQGNKYGYTPLPKSVDEADLQQHLTLRECSEEDRLLIFTWYKLDENSTPKRYYLKNLKSTDDPEYFRDFEKLLSLLIDLPFDKSYEGLQVGRSVTEWEIRAALDTFPCQLNRDDDICWSFRNFSGEIDDKMFCDINEKERGEKYWNDLISFMKSQIPQSSVEVYSADLTLLDMRNRTNKYDMYVDQFRKFTKAKMEASLQSVVECRQQWAKDGNGVGIPGLKLAEMLHHCTFAKEKCTTFIGRHNLTNNVLDVIQAPHREVEGNLDPFNPIHQFLGICVSIVGASGAGKTALMAKVASETFLQKSDDAVVVIRFCGTSPESMNARRLMLSISAQVEYLFDVAEKKVDLLFDEKYDKVVEYFQLLLRTYPVMLFIDSLDQLTDENQGRSQISFLKGVRPHPKTRIIVSCLPDDQIESAETGLKYVYLCETRLKSAHVPRVDVRMTTESALEESTEIIDTLLKRKGRTLQPHQRDMVRLRISETKELTALHISLLARVLSKWTGEVDADVSLQGGVVKLIEDFFNALQNEFGRDMTRMALAILTFSKKGISDIELEDILSSCDEVLDKVFQYATPSIRRLPSHVWLRLKASMTGLITEGEDNCMHWYHRQIKETAERTFHLEKATAHSLMGRYFGNLLESSLRDTRKIIKQHWTYSGNPLEESSEVNVRRCREATYHMIESGLIEEAARELCNFEGICCKIRCGEGFQLLRDFSSVIHALDSFHGSATVSKKRLHHYYWWLRRDMHYLSGNCLLRFSVSASSQPKLSDVRKDINALSFFPFKAYTLGGSDNFDPLQVELAGHTHYVNALAYCQGGDVLASGSSDGTVLLWDLSTGEVKSKLECCACMVKSVAWSPDGNLLAAGCGDKIIRLWDASRGEEIAKFVGHNSWVKSIVFSKDGKLLVSGSGDENILLWDVATAMKIGMLEGHSKAVNSVDFDPTGSILASGSDDNTVKLWDMPSGNVRFNFVGHSDKVNCVAFCADGKTLASGSYDHAIYLWDVDTETQKIKLLGHRLAILSLAFSPHGEILVSVSHDKTIRVWSVNNGETLATLEGHIHSINSVTFSPDGKNFASASDDKYIRLWDVSATKQNVSRAGHCDGVNALAFSPNGQMLATASDKDRIILWDLNTGEDVTNLTDRSVGANGLAFSPDGEILASCSGKLIRLWKLATGEEMVMLEGHTDEVVPLKFSPDGKMLASGSGDKTIRLWDVVDQREVRKLEGHSDLVSSIAFSPDGLNLVSSSCDATIRTWDIGTGEEKAKMEGHSDAIMCISLSQDGKTIASGSMDTSVLVWDAATGKQKAKLGGHNSYVFSVAISPDGKWLASGHADNSINMWDVETGEKKATLDGHRGWVQALTFSPDGKLLASGSEDKVIRLWSIVDSGSV